MLFPIDFDQSFWTQSNLLWRNASSLFKVLLFFIVWLGCWLPIAIPLAIGVKWHPFKPLTLAQKLPLLSSLYLVAPFVIWGSAALTGETFAQLGLPWQAGLLRSLGLGLGAGVVGLGGMFVLQERWGWLKLATRPSAALSSSAVQTLLLMLLLGLWVGGIEEMVFRGFLFNQLRQDYPFWLAGAIASLIFALLHLVWEGSKNLPQLPGLWLMGMALILARNADGGNLGLAWGLHAGWVWTIASLDSLQAVTYKQRVPEWITGWGGQPLAGAIGIGFMAIVALLLWVIEA